ATGTKATMLVVPSMGAQYIEPPWAGLSNLPGRIQKHVMRLPPGTRLGSYEILSLVGVGGMGEVYRARDTKLNRDIALKILLEREAADPQRRARFAREAQSVAA